MGREGSKKLAGFALRALTALPEMREKPSDETQGSPSKASLFFSPLTFRVPLQQGRFRIGPTSEVPCLCP
ncbi:hypothetical protein ASAP_2903 [Asaia bogorensis]|uniref:Uncharacterized protein n=1 Tax=Asaia bogorensis TaxID=91915 RepID=A0A060QJQ6_9PROT|nr:hypothetical protein ASAP_2903 [Asaia bogorensis]